jgi:U4/U6.U5 tri-snRNP-associated protein 1
MSSTDTPLNTLKMLQEKQKELQSPFIVLTGGQKTGIQYVFASTKYEYCHKKDFFSTFLQNYYFKNQIMEQKYF